MTFKSIYEAIKNIFVPNKKTYKVDTGWYDLRISRIDTPILPTPKMKVVLDALGKEVEDFRIEMGYIYCILAGGSTIMIKTNGIIYYYNNKINDLSRYFDNEITIERAVALMKKSDRLNTFK